MMPALQQVRGIQFLLLTAGLFPLVFAVLPRTQSFEDFTFAVSLLVRSGRLLPQDFELVDVGLQFLAKAMQILTEDGSELEFGSGSPGKQASGIGTRGIGEEAVQLRQPILGPGDCEAGLLQLESALPFDAFAEAEEGIESEAERHNL